MLSELSLKTSLVTSGFTVDSSSSFPSVYLSDGSLLCNLSLELRLICNLKEGCREWPGVGVGVFHVLPRGSLMKEDLRDWRPRLLDAAWLLLRMGCFWLVDLEREFPRVFLLH
jgi:hypothetical protein